MNIILQTTEFVVYDMPPTIMNKAAGESIMQAKNVRK